MVVEYMCIGDGLPLKKETKKYFINQGVKRDVQSILSHRGFGVGQSPLLCNGMGYFVNVGLHPWFWTMVL